MDGMWPSVHLYAPRHDAWRMWLVCVCVLHRNRQGGRHTAMQSSIVGVLWLSLGVCGVDRSQEEPANERMDTHPLTSLHTHTLTTRQAGRQAARQPVTPSNSAVAWVGVCM